jgi:hypothetical protein
MKSEIKQRLSFREVSMTLRDHLPQEEHHLREDTDENYAA